MPFIQTTLWFEEFRVHSGSFHAAVGVSFESVRLPHAGPAGDNFYFAFKKTAEKFAG